jgi:hypothetical protein
MAQHTARIMSTTSIECKQHGDEERYRDAKEGRVWIGGAIMSRSTRGSTEEQR